MSALGHDYAVQNEKLFQIVLKYAKDIIPYNVLHVFHNYDQKVLTYQDIETIKLKVKKMTKLEAAMELLDVLKRYEGWYPCLIKVLSNEDVKLGHVAKFIEDDVGKLQAPDSQLHNELQSDSYYGQADERNQIIQLLQENQKLKNIIDDRNNDLSQKTAEVISLSETNEELNKDLQSLTHELQHEKDKSQDLTNELQREKDKSQDLSNELQCEKGKSQCLTKVLRCERVEKDKEIQALKNEITKRNNEISGLKKAEEQQKAKEINTHAQDEALDNPQEGLSNLPSSPGLACPGTSVAVSSFLPASRPTSLPRDITDALDKLVRCSSSLSDLKNSKCLTQLLDFTGNVENEPYRSAIGEFLVESKYTKTVPNILSQDCLTDAQRKTLHKMISIWSILSVSSDQFTKSLADNHAVKRIVLLLQCKVYQEAADKYTQRAALLLICILHNIAVSMGPSSCFKDIRTSEILQVYVKNQNKGIKMASTLTLAHVLEKEEQPVLRADTEIIKDTIQVIRMSYIENPASNAQAIDRDEIFPAQRLLLGLAKLALNEDNAQEIIRQDVLKDFLHVLHTGKPADQLCATICVRNLARHSSVRKEHFCFSVCLRQLQELQPQVQDEHLKQTVLEAIHVIEGK